MTSVPFSTLNRTPLFGGHTGQPYNDLDSLSVQGKLKLDDQQPIVKICVCAGWIVDCIEITYKRSADEQVTYVHGNKRGGHEEIVSMDASDIVTSVFGRAGYQEYYRCELINAIGFTVFNRSSCTTRTFGPFGNGNNSNNGEPFCVGAVVAFGGYSHSLGLAGLFMYERTAGLHDPSLSSSLPVQIRIPPATSPEGHIVAAVMWPNSSEADDPYQVFSKFIVVAKFRLSPDVPGPLITLLVNTDIAMPRFRSKGATDDTQSESSLEVTFHKQDDVTGFARFWGTIGHGELHFTTNKKVVISGPIEGGPLENQTFIGSGTWLMS